MKRRGFLSSAGTVGVAGLLGPAALLSQAVLAEVAVQGRAAFEARVGEGFYLYDNEAQHQSQLYLFRVEDSGSTAELEQFALQFYSLPGATALPDGMYDVAGESLQLYVKHTANFWGFQLYIAEFSLLS